MMARLGALKLKGTAKVRGGGFPYFFFPPLPSENSIEEMEGASFGVPLPERRREQRDGCTLVKSRKRRPAIGTELAAVARCHDCPGQLEKGVVKIRLIQQGWGGCQAEDLPAWAGALLCHPKGWFVPGGRNVCSKVAKAV